MKKQTWDKRILSILLAAVMVFSLVSGLTLTTAQAMDGNIIYDMQDDPDLERFAGPGDSTHWLLTHRSGFIRTVNMDTSPRTITLSNRGGTSQGVDLRLSALDTSPGYSYRFEFTGRVLTGTGNHTIFLGKAIGNAAGDVLVQALVPTNADFTITATATHGQIMGDAAVTDQVYRLGGASGQNLLITGIVITEIPSPTPPVISTPPGALASGVLNGAYNQALAASNNPTSWIVSSGALPAGLTLSDSGVISGTPTETGTFDFNVTATNSDGTSAPVAFSIVIAVDSPVITTTQLPNGTVGSAYIAELMATGTPPIAWSVSAGSLPNGLSLDAESGRIYGQPTRPGTFTFTIKADNGAPLVAAKEFAIVIYDSAAPGDPVADVADMIKALPWADEINDRADVDAALNAIFDAWESATKSLSAAQQEELEERFLDMVRKLEGLIAKIAAINHSDGKVTAELPLEAWYWRLDAMSLSGIQENRFLDALGSNWYLLHLFDIKLTNLVTAGPWPSDGGPVVLTISGLNLQGATNVEVGHLRLDGRMEYLEARVSEGMVIFKTQSFSLFGVISTSRVEGGENGTGGGPINRPGTGRPVSPGDGGSGGGTINRPGGGMASPQTGDDMPLWIFPMAASAIGLVSVPAWHRRRRLN